MDIIDVYTDGSCNNKTGDAGFGIYLIYKSEFDEPKEIRYSRYIGKATNNIAELTAIKISLKKLKKYRSLQIRIFTDSKYCIGVLTKGWKVNANVDLVNEIKELIIPFNNIDLRWVKGHSFCEGNKIADKIAVKARKSLQSK